MRAAPEHIDSCTGDVLYIHTAGPPVNRWHDEFQSFPVLEESAHIAQRSFTPFALQAADRVSLMHHSEFRLLAPMSMDAPSEWQNV